MVYNAKYRFFLCIDATYFIRNDIGVPIEAYRVTMVCNNFQNSNIVETPKNWARDIFMRYATVTLKFDFL